jgi:hypothetical protein
MAIDADRNMLEAAVQSMAMDFKVIGERDSDGAQSSAGIEGEAEGREETEEAWRVQPVPHISIAT